MFFNRKCVNVAAITFLSFDESSIFGCDPSSIMNTGGLLLDGTFEGGKK